MASQSYIQDQLTDRSIDVIRAANGSARRASAEFPALMREISALLASVPVDQYYLIAAQVEALVLDTLTQISEDIADDLVQLSAAEVGFTSSMLTEATTLVAAARPPEQVVAAFTRQPMQLTSGQTVSQVTSEDIFSRMLFDSTTISPQAVGRVVRDAQINGDSAQDVSRKIADNFNGQRKPIQADVQTLFNHWSNTARESVYDANDDIIEGVKLLATLDSRTTLICAKHDTESAYTIYPINSGPRPPFHVRCRTIAQVVVKPEYRIDVPGAKRAAEGGTVGAQTKYQGWFMQQSAEKQLEKLGPTRYRLFKEGLPITKFTDDMNRTLTIAQLQARYPERFSDAAQRLVQ